jgi:serine/threonine protein kinase
MGAKVAKNGSTPEFSLDDYSIDVKTRIGVGASAIIYKAIHKSTRASVAVKGSSFMDKYDDQGIQMLSKLDHPNLIKVHGYEVVERGEGIYKWFRVYAVMDLAETDLKTILQYQPTYFQDVKRIRYFMHSMIDVLSYLYLKKIYYRDIYTSNILWIDSKWVLGHTKAAKDRSNYGPRSVQTLTGSKEYEAPENFKVSDDLEWNEWHKCDVFSMGRVFMEVCGVRFAGTEKLGFNTNSKFVKENIFTISQRFPKDTWIVEVLNDMVQVKSDNQLGQVESNEVKDHIILPNILTAVELSKILKEHSEENKKLP